VFVRFIFFFIRFSTWYFFFFFSENKQNNEKRAVRTEWHKLDIDGQGTMRWRRIIAGTEIIIPFPPKPKEPERESKFLELRRNSKYEFEFH
jgi:hypothetical protein